jgi:YVTN family beta-propeller protein
MPAVQESSNGEWRPFPRRAATLLVLAVALSVAACSRPSAPPPTQPSRVLVTNEGSGTLSVIDPATRAVVATIALGKRPRGVQVGPSGDVAYVALSGSPTAGPGVDADKLPPADRAADGIGVVDLRANRLVRMVRVGNDPEQLAVSADGRRLVVANEDSGTASLIDIRTGKLLAVMPVGREPEGVALSPDGGLIAVTSEADGRLTFVETSTMTVTASVHVGARPRSVVFLPDSSRAFVTLESDAAVAIVDVAQRATTGQIKIPGDNVRPMGLALSKDGMRLYVTTGRGQQVVGIDTASGTSVAAAVVGLRPWGVALAPDGRTLYTANGPSNDVSVVDATTLQVLVRIPVGDRPWGVAMAGAR